MMRYNSQSLSWKTSLLVRFFFSVANTLEKVCTTWTMTNKDISYNCETAVEQIKVVHRNQPCPLWYQNSSDSCGHRHRTSHGNVGSRAFGFMGWWDICASHLFWQISRSLDLIGIFGVQISTLCFLRCSWRQYWAVFIRRTGSPSSAAEVADTWGRRCLCQGGLGTCQKITSTSTALF